MSFRPDHDSTAHRAPRFAPRHRKLQAGIVVAVLAVVVASGILTWRQHEAAERQRATLPAIPTLFRQPPILGELLARAEAKAKSPDTWLDGTIDLGRLYHANGFHEQAAACWKIMRVEQPDEARWCYYLADLRRVASDYEGMAALLERTLAFAPDYPPARLQLANLQFKSGETAAAAHNYQLRLKLLPHDPYAQLGLARVALLAGQNKQARALLEQLLRDAPNFSSGHNLYAEILAAAGDTAAADQQRWLGRETLRYREPEDPWLDQLQDWCYDYDRLCVLGTGEMQIEHRARAQSLFERAIRLRTNAPEAYERLAALELKYNEPARVIQLLEPVLPRLRGKIPAGIFTSLALAYRRTKQPAEAFRIARSGLEQLGKNPELLDALGLALADLDRHDEAVDAWRAALLQNPNDATMNYSLAISLLALGRLDEALEALDRSLIKQPTFLPTLLLRGQIELDAGHVELAGNYLRPAFDSHPEELQARQLLARWHQQMGDAAESKGDAVAAERHYRDGLIVDGNNVELLLGLGTFYLARARYAEAINPLEIAGRLQPQNPRTCLFLGQAYAATNNLEKARAILTTGAALAERAHDAATGNGCRQLLRHLQP